MFRLYGSVGVESVPATRSLGVEVRSGNETPDPRSVVCPANLQE